VVADLILRSNQSNCDYYKALLGGKKQGFNPITETEACMEVNAGSLSKVRSNMCSCFMKVMGQTREIIKVNESVWFHWIKNVVGYADEYMPNYFIKRLVSTTTPRRYEDKKFLHSSNCIAFNNCTEDAYSILSNSYQLRPGIGYSEKGMNVSIPATYYLKKALQISKLLLQHQIDFVVMEYFDQPQTIAALKFALHNEFTPPLSFMSRNDNRGMFNPSNISHSVSAKHLQKNRSEHSLSRRRRLLASNYRQQMPVSVLNFLEKDNAEDIELYKFAVREFEARAAREGWAQQ